MNRTIGGLRAAFLFVLVACCITTATFAQQIKLAEKAPDPHGSPRPARDARDVPLRTSIYFEIAAPADAKEKAADRRSIAVSIEPQGGKRSTLLNTSERFSGGVAGWVRESNKSVFVYIEPGVALKPSTHYTVRVSGAAIGASAPGEIGSWSFTTEAAPTVHAINYRLDLSTAPVQWHGGFFTGICDVIFCTQASNYGPTWDLISQASKTHPRAWSLQRDFWLTGTDNRPPGGFFPSNLPNIVRERETRRIAKMEPTKDGNITLHIEDFVGHEQYGIPSNRPISEDYHPGDEVLVADGVNNARAKVIAADDRARTVTVSSFATPQGGWKIAYEGPLPTHEDPDAPGLFPPGGCYLRKYAPHGTACYYWGRLDKEWDLAHRDGRRVMPNFADAPGDLSRDGKSWNTVKDYAQWHEVVRAITGHIIDRYGKDALSYTWTIFNEPDLWILFWHASWDDLQTYYDYTTDGILRAFEDRGYDSSHVFIGGLELGAVFGTNLKLQEFLTHCSPRATAPGALPKNTAVADHRLDGKRSRRVESLCAAHGGKGSPCDFISIHSYNRSSMMAAKLIHAKEMALEIDPDYYKTLHVDSHESCPDWMPPPDEAAGDTYLGDGYFPTWCLDVVHRQLLRATADPRYAYGETIVTVWPPPDNFATLNAISRNIHYRDDDAGHTQHTMTVPMPVFHVLNLLSDFGDRYWVLPEQAVDAEHIVGGFASREKDGAIRALLYVHDASDTQSRSDATFDVSLDLASLNWTGPASVREYRFDRDHNSPYRTIRQIGGTPRRTSPGPEVYSKAQAEQVRHACECKSTVEAREVEQDKSLHLTVNLEENGCAFLVIAPIH